MKWIALSVMQQVPGGHWIVYQLVKAMVTTFSYSLFRCITDEKYVNWTLRVASVHGHKAPLPFIKSIEVII